MSISKNLNRNLACKKPYEGSICSENSNLRKGKKLFIYLHSFFTNVTNDKSVTIDKLFHFSPFTYHLSLITFLSFFTLTFAQNYSLDFDGTDDYVDCGNDPSLDNENALTIGVWIKTSGTTDEAGIVTKGTGVDVDDGIALRIRLGIPAFSALKKDDSGYWDLFTGTSVLDGEWHYVVGTFNTTSMKRYLDGELEQEMTTGQPYLISSVNAKIGIGGHGAGAYFNGIIDDVTIWNDALTSEEVLYYMSNPPIGNEENLIAYWKFNTGGGDTLYDLSGNDNHGTIYGATWSEDVPAYGCIDPEAYNYDPDANFDDGTCSFDPPPGFEFNQSTMQAFYFFQTATVDDEVLASNDWIGAFNGDVCVGSFIWDGPYTTVPAMGDDGSDWTDGYLSPGVSPDFYIYDASNDMVLPAEFIGMEVPPFVPNELYNIPHLAAWTPDCNGEYGGIAEIDDCGVCAGGSTGLEPNADMDCAETCAPGTPVGDEQASDGMDFGAFLDDCEACSGGESGHITNSDDQGCGCYEPPPGTFYFDVDGDGLGAGDPVEFCFGAIPMDWVNNNDDEEPFCPTNNTDDCNVCGGDNAVMDCFGECFGGAVEDECGICGGNGASCNAPHAFNQNIVINEDESTVILIEAVDPNDDPLTYHLSMGPFHGTLSGEGPGVLYIPHPNYTGEDGFQYFVTDGEYESNFAFVHIQVLPVNDPPIVQNVDLVIEEDQAVPITLFAADPEGEEISYNITNMPSHGSLEPLELEELEFMGVVYIPDPNYYGEDTFSYSVNDGFQDSEDGVVSLIILPVNDAPFIQSDNYILDENTNISFEVNTFDIEGDALVIDIINGPFHGLLTQNMMTGEFNYSPAPGYIGFDQVAMQTIEAETDDLLFSIPKSFGFNIVNVNDAPVVFDAEYFMQEDDTLEFPIVVFDADGGMLLVPSLVQPPQNGSLSGGPSQAFYIPNPNYFGLEQIIYTVTDPEGLTSPPGEILIHVIPVNDAPVASPLSFSDVDPTSGFDFSLSGFVGDPEGDPILLLWLPSEESGSGETFFGGTITHIAGLNFRYEHSDPGTIDFILYKARDEFSESQLQLITFNIPDGTVMGGGRSSVQTFDDEVTVMEYDEFPMTFVGLDTTNLFPSDGTGVDVNVLVDAENGDLTGGYETEVSGGGSVITAETGFIGSGIGVGRSVTCDYELDVCIDTLVYQIYNPNSGEFSDSTSIIITVQGLNDPPALDGISNTTMEEDTDITVPISFSDPEGDGILLSAMVISNSDKLQVILENITETTADMLIIPTEDGEDFNGDCDISVTIVEDGTPDYSDTETFTITVSPVNDPPVVTVGLTEVFISEDGSETLELDAFDADGDTTFTFTVSVTDNPGLITLSQDGDSLTITAMADQSGTAEVTVTANDGEDDSTPVIFTVEVDDDPDSPEFTDINYNATVNEDEGDVVITFTPSDADGDNLTFGIYSSDENLIPLENIVFDQTSGPAGEQRTVTITPAENANGDLSVYLTMYDGSTAPVQNEFSISVIAVNDAPDISDIDPVSILEDQTEEINFQASDVEGDGIIFSIFGGTNVQAVLDSTSITFTPDADFSGAENFTLIASDGSDESTVIISVTVDAVNDAPQITSTPTTSGIEDEEYLYNVEISDPDSDTFTYSLDSQPSGMVISEEGVITWTPGEGDVSTDIITLTVTDDAVEPLFGTQTFTVTVTPVNDPPEITSIPPTEAEMNVEYSYQVIADDPENADMFFTIDGEPEGMVMDESQLITWTPIEEGVTVGPISIIVIDGLTEDALSDTQSFSIEIASSTVIMEFDLHDGANLISFYALPENTSVEFVMVSLGDCISGVIGEGVAASHLGGGTWVGSLANISQTSGYWVKLDDDCDLTVEGIPYDPSPLYELHDGANLISFPYGDMIGISAGLPDDVEPLFNGIIGEGVAASQTVPYNWVGSLANWEGKKGYWAKVTEALSFNFESSGLARNSEFPLSVRQAGNSEVPYPDSWSYNQSTKQAFYFVENLNIESHPEIDDGLILAYCGETLVGARQWNGQYTDIPTMGEDGFDETAGYCETGEIPTFMLLETSNQKPLPLTGNVPVWEENGLFFITLTENSVEIPTEFVLKPAYPNPFNPVTNIEFGLPITNYVSLVIYDITGRIVTELVKSELEAGWHSYKWNAENISSGLYFVKLTTEKFQQTQKVMLLK